MDWLAKMLGLPCHFLHHYPENKGGGVLQVSSVEIYKLIQISYWTSSWNIFAVSIFYELVAKRIQSRKRKLYHGITQRHKYVSICNVPTSNNNITVQKNMRKAISKEPQILCFKMVTISFFVIASSRYFLF